MEDPELFLKAHDGMLLALDEIHRLEDPALLLKIAADHFPRIRVCLLYTSDAADDLLCVALGGRRIIKTKNHTQIGIREA